MSKFEFQRINQRYNRIVIALLIVLLILPAGLSACTPSPSQSELEAIDYEPISRDDWRISTPDAQGLDPDLIAELYWEAAQVETIKSLLVVKNGYLIAEDYFNDGSIDQKARLQSATKSYTSALVGLALDQGCLVSVDQPVVEFFPELADQIRDPRKKDITLRHLLQMRAGFPWEESSEEMFTLLYSGFRPSNLVDVPLVRDPGTGMEYSSFSSHLLSISVSRACETDLLDFAREHLFGPLGVEPGEWITDWEGYRNGHGDLHLRARDMAKFGLIYLQAGGKVSKSSRQRGWMNRCRSIPKTPGQYVSAPTTRISVMAISGGRLEPETIAGITPGGMGVSRSPCWKTRIW